MMAVLGIIFKALGFMNYLAFQMIKLYSGHDGIGQMMRERQRSADRLLRRPMTKEQIEAITKFAEKTVEKNMISTKTTCTQECCPICINGWRFKQRFLSLGCGHCFHTNCLHPWLLQRNDCPLCRRVVDMAAFPKSDVKLVAQSSYSEVSDSGSCKKLRKCSLHEENS